MSKEAEKYLIEQVLKPLVQSHEDRYQTVDEMIEQPEFALIAKAMRAFADERNAELQKVRQAELHACKKQVESLKSKLDGLSEKAQAIIHVWESGDGTEPIGLLMNELKKQLIQRVSNQRELLLAFAGWLYGNLDKEVEERIVDNYLNSN
jgi:hypothetical protein